MIRLRNKAVKFVAGWEGWRPCPYWDAIGRVWTQGYGETQGVGPNSPCWTEKYGRKRLRKRLKKDYAPFVPRRRRMLPREIAALASFAYNCGPGAVSNPAISTLARRLKGPEGKTYKGRKRIYREELPKWTSGGIPGLVKRRAAEVKLACEGDYSGRP